MKYKKKGAWWVCGHGHRFYYGNEKWHHEEEQGWHDVYLVPCYCTYVDEFGEPCMDSSSLECEDYGFWDDDEAI